MWHNRPLLWTLVAPGPITLGTCGATNLAQSRALPQFSPLASIGVPVYNAGASLHETIWRPTGTRGTGPEPRGAYYEPEDSEMCRCGTALRPVTEWGSGIHSSQIRIDDEKRPQSGQSPLAGPHLSIRIDTQHQHRDDDNQSPVGSHSQHSSPLSVSISGDHYEGRSLRGFPVERTLPIALHYPFRVWSSMGCNPTWEQTGNSHQLLMRVSPERGLSGDA